MDDRTVRVQLVPGNGGANWGGFVRPPTQDETVEGCPLGTIRCSNHRTVNLTALIDGVAVTGTATLRFDNRGYSVNAQGAPTEVLVQLVHQNSTSDRHRRCVRVFPGGQVDFDLGECTTPEE